MSVAKVVTASGDLVIPKQSIIYGIHLTVHHLAAGAPPSDPCIVDVFNAATQAAGSATNKVAQLVAMASQQAAHQSILFPAGVRCLNGGSVTITANGNVVSVTIDYS
tara:strand:- start:314 stop:634 length:321 start_codon:yes stop_codon:yes gene_type:complete